MVARRRGRSATASCARCGKTGTPGRAPSSRAASSSYTTREEEGGASGCTTRRPGAKSRSSSAAMGGATGTAPSWWTAGSRFRRATRTITPRAASWTSGGCGERLPIDPIRQLHQEAVVGPQAEQIAQVAAEGTRPLDAGGSLAPLTPDYEQRRAGAVLPTEHDVGAELLVVEAAGVVGDGGVAVHLVAAREIRRPRACRQLPHVAVGPLRDERLRVHLERHARIEGVGDAYGHAELLLLQVGEQVVRHLARIRDGIPRLHFVRGARVAGDERRRDARRQLEVDLRAHVDAAGPPAVAPPIVDPEVRHDRSAVVAVQAGPGREV